MNRRSFFESLISLFVLPNVKLKTSFKIIPKATRRFSAEDELIRNLSMEIAKEMDDRIMKSLI